MNNRFSKVLAITRINLKQSKFAYIFTAGMFVCFFAMIILNNAIKHMGGNNLDIGCAFYFLIIFAPILIPARNFPRIMHLNGKKIDFYLGTYINYIILSAVVSLLSLVFLFITNSITQISTVSVIEGFGWLKNGAVVAFFQQFAFLLLASTIIHTLTTIQTNWVGWVVDILIVAVISVFLPIPPLNAALTWFFHIIIFQDSAALQIFTCIMFSLVIYGIDLLALYRKKI